MVWPRLFWSKKESLWTAVGGDDVKQHLSILLAHFILYMHNAMFHYIRAVSFSSLEYLCTLHLQFSIHLFFKMQFEFFLPNHSILIAVVIIYIRTWWLCYIVDTTSWLETCSREIQLNMASGCSAFYWGRLMSVVSVQCATWWNAVVRGEWKTGDKLWIWLFT